MSDSEDQPSSDSEAEQPDTEQPDTEQPDTEQPGADPDDAEQIEKEREERLDPENRPDGVEVDNTDRDFDETKGMFTDSEGYEAVEAEYPAAGEAPA